MTNDHASARMNMRRPNTLNSAESDVGQRCGPRRSPVQSHWRKPAQEVGLPPVRADQERRNFRAQSHFVTALPVFGSSLWPPVGTSRVRVAASTGTGLSQDSSSEGEWDARGAMPKDHHRVQPLNPQVTRPLTTPTARPRHQDQLWGVFGTGSHRHPATVTVSHRRLQLRKTCP